MITRPDEYKHQNDAYAIVDNDNVRGGIFDVVDLTTNNINAIPADKRKLRSSIVNGVDSKLYIYTGTTLDNTAWGTVGNWIAASGSEYTHPSGFTSQPTSALTGANVISQVTVNANGHVTGVTSRQLTAGDIGAATSSHTHSNATTSVAGFMSSTDKTKLDGITAGAEPNQNAFGKVTVGGTDILATGESDGLILSAGSNITLTPNALTKSVTISSTGGSGAYSFGTIAVSGQTNVVADSTNDTLTLVAGNGISLTTSPTGDSVTISQNSILTADTSLICTSTTTWNEIVNFLSNLPTNLGGKRVTVALYSGNTYIYTGIISSGIYNCYNGKINITTTGVSKATLNMGQTSTGYFATTGYGLEITISNINFISTSNLTGQYISVLGGKNSLGIVDCIFDYNGVDATGMSDAGSPIYTFATTYISTCTFEFNYGSGTAPTVTQIVRLGGPGGNTILFSNITSNYPPTNLIKIGAGTNGIFQICKKAADIFTVSAVSTVDNSKQLYGIVNML